MRAQPQVVQVQVKRVRPVGIEIPKGATVATESDIYDRAASIFYDAAGETLKESGLRKYVEMVRQAYPTLNILELIKKTYDDATTILDPVMPGTQEGNDLYNRLCNDISYTLNRMTPTLIAR